MYCVIPICGLHCSMAMIRILSSFLICLFCFSELDAQERNIGILYNSELSYAGYTLYAPTGYTSTYLLDNCGSSVMEWESDYSTGLSAYLSEDGQLFRTGRLGSSNAFAGAGVGGVLERFGANGELEWSAEINTDSIGFHHDIHVMPNGNVLGIAWERFSRETTIALGRDEGLVGQDFWMPAIFEIKPIEPRIA